MRKLQAVVIGLFCGIVTCNNEESSICLTHEQCADDQSCVNLTCESPCSYLCGGNTTCHVKRHTAVCACKPGYSGDPLSGCSKPKFSNCRTHEDCPDDQACVGQKCERPCNFCGCNTSCQVKNHTAACSCKPGYAGDPFTGCNQQCSELWPPFPGARKIYKVEAIKVNWYTALAQCLSHGGRLATILSSLENDQIKDVIARSGLRPQFWVSGTDYSLQDHWTWMSTGLPFAFSDWTPGQLDNWQNLPGGEHCLELWETGQYRWNDRNCMELQYPICEYYV